MSTLVITLPPRPRLSPGAPAAAPADDGTEYTYALADDALQPRQQGACAAALLPRADTVVAVLADLDVSWHAITCPKAPAGRLRAALAGLLEEQLLDDPEHLHLALSPQAQPGKPAWVAATDRAWLADHLARLEKAGAFVERVVPLSRPDEPAEAHFFAAAAAPDGRADNTWLVRGSAQGVQALRLAGTQAAALLPGWRDQTPRFTSQPMVAAQAERWLGRPVAVVTETERALNAARTLWNLRQFELAPRHRGVRALRDLAKPWRTPAWRPVRLGLAGLLVLNLVGLNLWAWQQRQAVAAQRQAQVALLKQAHPQVRAVLDAPAQMQREAEVLRASAGRAGDGDLEVLLAAAAQAWPEGLPPVEQLRYEPGRLTLGGARLSPQQVQALRERLAPVGFALEAAEGRLVLSRAAAPRT